MEIILDFSGLTNREELYDYLERKLDTPDYFGRNLDALEEVLSGNRNQYRLNGIGELKQYLGEYTDELIKLFDDLNNE